MDQLWAPWRLAYVTNPEKPKQNGTQNDCFICRGLSAQEDRTNYIVHRSANSAVILNRFPYNNGHLLIVPQSHVPSPCDLNDQETIDLQHLIGKVMSIYDQIMKPDGYNIGLNLGKVAGAGLPGHLHWHLVPRWNGDMNFMPVLSETSVIVQSLDVLYELLKAHWK